MSSTRGAFATSEDARKAGWFSRRHKTSKAHDEAKAKREQKRDRRRLRETSLGVSAPTPKGGTRE